MSLDSQVIVNNIKVEEAMKVCDFVGIVPVSTVYSCVLSARKKGTYDVLKLREEQEIRNLVIAIQDDGGNPLSEQEPTVSPVTTTTTDASTMTTTEASLGSSNKQSRQSFRKSSKQASNIRLEMKTEKEEYDIMYKVAFKEATYLLAADVAGIVPSEPVQDMCNRLNAQYGLVSGPGCKQLTQSTIYQAAKDGLAGQSPKKRGPAPKIPDAFLDGLATHAQVCQVGNGELRANHMKHVIGASIMGTEYENAFKVDSVWKKVCEKHPQRFVAANKMTVEDARAQWTTHDNLDQWFDDVKFDLLATEMVVDEIELDENGDLVSKVRFKPDILKRRIINMDETHHDSSITGDKGGSRSVTYHNPLLQRGANRGVKSARHVTGAYATTAAGEVLPPFYIFDSSSKSEENFRVRVEWLAALPIVIVGLDAQRFKRICTASMLFDLADRWTNHSSISILSL
jgi:hypothetical protein